MIAISHGGLDDSPYSPTMENGNFHLSKVPGIDAMLIGHSHQIFPNAASSVAQFNLPGVDKAAGHGQRRADHDGRTCGASTSA